jgi:hypothetical protein
MQKNHLSEFMNSEIQARGQSRGELQGQEAKPASYKITEALECPDLVKCICIDRAMAETSQE